MKKESVFRTVVLIGVVLLLVSLVVIITKTPQPKPKPGSIDIIDKANLNPGEFGGDYMLLNQEGKSFDSKSLRGKYQLVYFGFTNCPDICPASIIEMSKAVNIVNNNKSYKDSLVPIFITVDPERDNVEKLKSYFDAIDPRIIALTGDVQKISQVARDFRVYYSTAKGAKKDSDDYMINHSSFFYLIGPDGKFIKHYIPGAKGDEIAKDYLDIKQENAS